MSLVIDLPKDLSLTLLRNWLSLRDIVRLDTAICSESLRQHWLQLLANEVINCSTVNLRDKDLAKLRWLMVRNAFCNKIAFRSCRIRDYKVPFEFLVKWMQQCMHLKTLRFKEKTHISFQLLEKLLLIKFIQRKKINPIDFFPEGEILYWPFDLPVEGEAEDGLNPLKRRRISFDPKPGLSETVLTADPPFPPVDLSHLQLPYYGPSQHSNGVSSNGHTTYPSQGTQPESNSTSNNLAPFDLSLSPIPVIEQADSLPPRNVSLQTELMTANIAHPLTAMEVIERMIQRTLSNLKEHQRYHDQQFHQPSRSSHKRSRDSSNKPVGHQRNQSLSHIDNSNSTTCIKIDSYDDAEDLEVIDLTTGEEEVQLNNEVKNNCNNNQNDNNIHQSMQSEDLPVEGNTAVLDLATLSPLSAPVTNPTCETTSSQPQTNANRNSNSNTNSDTTSNTDKPIEHPESSTQGWKGKAPRSKQSTLDRLVEANEQELERKRLLLQQLPPNLKYETIFQNIEELYFHFHDMSLLTSYFLQQLFPQVPKLKIFTIIDCMKVTDEDINQLIRSCPLIEEIMIDNCSLIQGLFFPNLIQTSSQLNKIMIKHCQVISKSAAPLMATFQQNIAELFQLPFPTATNSTTTASNTSFGSPNPIGEDPHQTTNLDHLLFGCQGLLDYRRAMATPLTGKRSNKNNNCSSSNYNNCQKAPLPPSYAQIKFHHKLVCCDFTHSRDIGDYLLPYVLFYCPNIERMNISFCHLTHYQFQYLYTFCHRLKVLFLPGNTIDDEIIVPIVSHCDQLESMVIGFSPRVTEKSIYAIANHLTLLKTFALWGNHRALTEDSMKRLVTGCSLLEKVALTYTGTTDEVLEILVTHCPLTRIEINGCQLLTDRCVESVARHCGQRLTHFVAENVLLSDEGCEYLAQCVALEYINLSNCKKITSKGMIAVLRHCPKIEILKLKECQLLDDEFLTEVAVSGKQLKELDISYIKQFSLQAVLTILERCDHLHKVYMIACFQDHFTQQAMNQDTIQEIVKTGTKKRIHIMH